MLRQPIVLHCKYTPSLESVHAIHSPRQRRLARLVAFFSHTLALPRIRQLQRIGLSCNVFDSEKKPKNSDISLAHFCTGVTL